MPDDNIEIIGFDLGHGETALARTRRNAGGEPTPLEIGGGRSTVTAVARDADGRIVIGRDVITFSSSLVETYIRFKHPNLDAHLAAGKATRLFVRGVLDHLIATRQIDSPDQAFFLVGCPSGWGPRVQSLYQAVLEQGGLRNVRVVPESRAAFLHARESRELSSSQLAGRVLLIDVGSSTTDFTFSENLNTRPVDYGHTDIGDIGGGLIDQAVLEYSIGNQSNANAVRSFLERNPGKRAEVDLKCRDAKHEYFNEKQGSGREVWQAVRLERGLQLEISLDDAIMERIKNTPLPELGGRSFVSAFAARLSHVKEQIGCLPDYIVVTGGAARMQFVVDLINDAFPNVKTIRGAEPELAVAKGLAWFGRSQLQSQAFQRDVEDLIGSGQVNQLVSKNMEKLFSRLAEDLGTALINRVLRDEIILWRSGSTATLLDMEVRAKQRIEEFLQGDAARDLVSGTTREWFEEIRPEVQALTDPICLKYRIPTSALEISADTHFSTKAPLTSDLSGVVADDLDQFGTVINAVVAAVSGMVLGGAGIALLHIPVFGHILTGVGVFVALMIGKEAMREQVKSWNIPSLLRRLVTENNIDAKLKSSLPELVGGLRQTFGDMEQDHPSGQRLADRIAAQIGSGLRQRGDDAILQF
jgi:hypothetical protein